jgi:beta-glucosidase
MVFEEDRMRIKSRARSRIARAPWLAQLALPPAALAVSAMVGCLPEQAEEQAPEDESTAAATLIDPSCRNFPAVPTFNDFPAITSLITQDPTIEARIKTILGGMTLAQKVGQMTQAEIQSITPAQVQQFAIGSVLNGGGSWPSNNKHATPADWTARADAYWQASMSTPSKIPIIWGIDAVHGNNNVFGTTLFPHNIGLGAARDTCLLRNIGAMTAQQVRVSGQDWAFAPTLAVVRDDRWGRTYEGYSEDPSVTRVYADAMMHGLQGNPNTSSTSFTGVIATAKHFIGDGGTANGTDQGVNMSSLSDMVNIHGQGYYGALAAGAQTVMVSYSSWTNPAAGINEGKMSGSHHMLTDVIRTKMGFDGLLVSDFNAIGQVPGCTNSSCPQAVNAGIDLFMVPTDWQAFISNTVAQVQNGQIPMSRIDDAVTHILRVKLRAGLFNEPKPSQRAMAGDATKLVNRALARQAVQESLVLLKNNNNVLPLARNQKILVIGKSADSFSNQSGGWSLTWQGTGNTNADYATGDTILTGIKNTVGASQVTFSADGTGVNVASFGAVIAVIGETPYAEFMGDIASTGTLEHARRFPEDIAALNRVRGQGVPVVTVLLSGRPLYTNKELNASDAFVAGWLIGTEGGGVADVLFRNASGGINVDFTGKLSYSWPRAACQTPLNVGQPSYNPLFAFGFGLTYSDHQTLGALDETSVSGGCGNGTGAPHTGPFTGFGGKCVDVAAASTANGTAIQLFDCNGTNAQQWTIATDGSIQALGKCLDVTAAGTANGAVTQLFDCNGTGAQQWAPQANGSLVNPASGRCLDATGPSSANGTRLQIWDCSGNANQKWTLP